MTMPNESGFYRARIALDNNNDDGVWTCVHVLKQDGEFVFTVPGESGTYPLSRECGPKGIVLEWGSEIEVDPVKVMIDHFEDVVDDAAKDGAIKDGVIGRFEGVDVSERFTKKALMGVIIRMMRWNDLCLK